MYPNTQCVLPVEITWVLPQSTHYQMVSGGVCMPHLQTQVASVTTIVEVFRKPFKCCHSIVLMYAWVLVVLGYGG